MTEKETLTQKLLKIKAFRIYVYALAVFMPVYPMASCGIDNYHNRNVSLDNDERIKSFIQSNGLDMETAREHFLQSVLSSEVYGGGDHPHVKKHRVPVAWYAESEEEGYSLEAEEYMEEFSRQTGIPAIRKQRKEEANYVIYVGKNMPYFLKYLEDFYIEKEVEYDKKEIKNAVPGNCATLPISRYGFIESSMMLYVPSIGDISFKKCLNRSLMFFLGAGGTVKKVPSIKHENSQIQNLTKYDTLTLMILYNDRVEPRDTKVGLLGFFPRLFK